MSQFRRVIFAIKNLHAAAGTEKATICIANGLAERGHAIYLVVLEKTGEPFFQISPLVSVRYCWPTKDSRPFFKKIPGRLRKLRETFLELKPDLIIQVGSGRSFLFLPPSRGFTFATWEHFNIKINWNLLQPLSKFLASKLGDYIITLTTLDAVSYQKKFNANALCIPNAYDLSGKSYNPYTTASKVISATGRLTHQKGFDLLIQAWSMTNTCKTTGWKLQIIGSGKDETQLKKLANQLGVSDSITFIPATPDAIQYMSESRCFVLSSRYEGLPLVLLEAMALGLPVIAFDCYTGPQELINDGSNGFLIKPFDTHAFAKAIDQLATNTTLCEQMSINAQKTAENYCIPAILDRWENLLNSIA